MVERLVEDGAADTLVISYFPDDVSNGSSATTEAQIRVSNYCEIGGRESILCFTPEEDATSEKLMRFETLPQGEAGDSLDVVTIMQCAFRTWHIFSQWLGSEVDVNVVFSQADLS